MIIAAPSFVMAAGVAQNARFLAGRVHEVALCFFECRACLAYGSEDLPADLRALPLSWHMHLPFDLPWEDGGAAAARTALAVAAKAAILPVRRAVLHPPGGKDQAGLLREFANKWKKESEIRLLLENTRDSDLCDLPPDIFRDFGFCLDVGHLLGYKQGSLLQNENLLRKAEIAHWSAPGGADRHLPLGGLTPEEKEAARHIAGFLQPGAVHLLEIFDWAGVESSIPVLTAILGGNVDSL